MVICLFVAVFLVQYYLVNILGGLKMTVAEVGNIVEFYDGLKGRVEKINDNSVIVDLTIMDNFEELDLPEKTVINHKRYKIIDQEG